MKSAPAKPADDTETKLLEAAGQVFAEVGFQSATVREICARAGANVAAVNYHYGDKMGLYIAVLKQSMLAAQAVALTDEMLHSVDPREALCHVIRTLFMRMSTAGHRFWYVRIMAHEMVQPTPALDRVATEVIGPNYLRFRQLVGRIIERAPDDDVTRMCAHSILGQLLHYVHARPVIQRIWPALGTSEEAQSAIADHIATFSLAGLDAAGKLGRRGGQVHRNGRKS